MLAELPFDNLSADPNEEYFADGITDDVVTRLVKSPGLMVIARDSQIMAANPDFSIQRMTQAFPFKNPAGMKHFIAGLRLAGLK